MTLLKEGEENNRNVGERKRGNINRTEKTEMGKRKKREEKEKMRERKEKLGFSGEENRRGKD